MLASANNFGPFFPKTGHPYRRILTLNSGGANRSSDEGRYRQAVLLDNSQSSVVDSYNQLLKFKKTLGVQGKNPSFKLTMNRGGSKNQSSIQGLIYQFSK